MSDITPNNPEVQVKTCPKCGECKPVSEFSKCKSRRDGLQCYCKSCKRRYQQASAEHIAEYHREYRKANFPRSPKRKQLDAERRRQWRQANAERIAKQKREYYQANVERIAEYSREYKRSNPEIYRGAEHRRRARKIAAGGTHSTSDIALLIKSATVRGHLRCWHCGGVCDGDYHIDHFIPLAKGGTDDIGNLRISCPKCNLRKSAKMPAEFNGRLL